MYPPGTMDLMAWANENAAYVEARCRPDLWVWLLAGLERYPAPMDVIENPVRVMQIVTGERISVTGGLA